jgi:small multidrug resistance pump
MEMHWVYLVCAIVLEVAGTTSMKLSRGFTKPYHSVMLFVFYGLSFAFLTMALKRLDVSIAYAIWSGLGTTLITLIGLYYFREPATVVKFLSIALIIAGVVGLRMSAIH